MVRKIPSNNSPQTFSLGPEGEQIEIEWVAPDQRKRRELDYLHGAALGSAKSPKLYAAALGAYHEALVAACVRKVTGYADDAGEIQTAEEFLTRGESDLVVGAARKIEEGLSDGR